MDILKKPVKMNHILSDFLSDTCNSLENLRKNNVYKEFYYHIKCENLEDFLSKDITQSVQYQDLLQDLMQIKGPVLYWYEITSSHSNNDIIRALKEYKQKRQRVTPVIYKNYNRRTNILYVGKCKENFWGRVMQHLGYYKTPTTQGLQLFHWAKELRLEVRLNALEFASDMKDIMPVIELFFAKQLQPLVGRHT